jgi:hypothetical protein
MSSGSITLIDVAARTGVLVVACTRCERQGRYGLTTLISSYGRGYGVPAVLVKLSDDCPRRKSVSGDCGIYCPRLADLLLGR